MEYYLSYNGKLLGRPMSKEKAEAKLQQMSNCIKGLEIQRVTQTRRGQRLPETDGGQQQSIL